MAWSDALVIVAVCGVAVLAVDLLLRLVGSIR